MTAAVRCGVTLLLAMAAAASNVMAQEPCAELAGPTLSLSAAHVRLPLASGTDASGTAFGVSGAARRGGSALAAEAEYIVLESGPARPLVGRLRATTLVKRLAGVHLCAALLAGAARTTRAGGTSGSDDSATNVSGGLSALVARGFAAGSLVVTPYAGVRGLAGRTSGSILDERVEATGYSLGGEGGLTLARGRAAAILRVTADDLDPALGPTPYPSLTVRLAAGLRF